MDRRGSAVVSALIAATSLGLLACAQPEVTSAEADVAAEAAFADMQLRGEQAMGVDQYTSTHVFDALPDGGRIELQRDVDDAAGTARIREHLQSIATAFAAGDFDTPAFVHMQHVPGTAAMAEKREAIRYEYRELPRGGELRLVTQDAEAVEAIHEFMSFQRQDHRAGGMKHGHHGDRGHERPDHDGQHHKPHDSNGTHHERHDRAGA